MDLSRKLIVTVVVVLYCLVPSLVRPIDLEGTFVLTLGPEDIDQHFLVVEEVESGQYLIIETGYAPMQPTEYRVFHGRLSGDRICFRSEFGTEFELAEEGGRVVFRALNLPEGDGNYFRRLRQGDIEKLFPEAK